MAFEFHAGVTGCFLNFVDLHHSEYMQFKSDEFYSTYLINGDLYSRN